MGDTVLYELDAERHVATITYNRPEALNAIDGEMRVDINDAFARFRDDEAAWVGIVTGAGRAFCAGADLRGNGNPVGEFPGTFWEKPTTNSFESGWEIFKPVIAAVNGHCLGYGLTLVTWCDFVIASERASFGYPEVRIGVPTIVGAIRLPAAARIEASNMLAELHEGWREFSSRTWLWTIVVAFGFINAAHSGASNVLGPTIARQELGGAAAWGLILSAQAAGLVLGGLLILWLKPRRILLVGCAAVLLALPGLLLLSVGAPTILIAAAYLLAGLGIEIFGVFWDTSLQQNIPQEKLSRVYSYDALGSFVLIPVGLIAAGPLAEAVGADETLWLAAGTIGLGVLAMLVVRDVRTLERATPSPSPASVAP